MVSIMLQRLITSFIVLHVDYPSVSFMDSLPLIQAIAKVTVGAGCEP